MFDRITEISETGGEFGKGVVHAELDVKPDLWFFGCHFKNDPVMPGCLGLDALWQMVGFYLGWIGGEGRGRALGAAQFEHEFPVHDVAVHEGKAGKDRCHDTLLKSSAQALGLEWR